ncbi:hypothetical protein CVT24_010080 [Panaeolus cyanescens]|uniref:F-box domain-containing protein n=1 Tax=Panaeolus cyanescens TaxID=181874 RepID=A0A409YQ09_9AGAR|nr:hypothetical protein CVT24_010080 [Panaeolus cyanescens]
MAISLIDIPQELLHKIALYATLSTVLGPPKELVNLTMTCRTLRDLLSPHNARDIYNLVFIHKFDALAPVHRLGQTAVRENAALEIRRRFSAMQTFKAKDRTVDDASLTEAFWVAYLMVEDSDTSQKNVKQLLHAGLPSFLDLYLRKSLHEGAESNDGWPVMSVKSSLAVALSWALTSQSSVSREDPVERVEMLSLLAPIVLTACRALSEAMPWTPYYERFPRSTFPPQTVNYFGAATREIRVPSAPLFAILLYCTRIETVKLSIPPHLKHRTRERSTLSGTVYPVNNTGNFSSEMENSLDSILWQQSFYKLGTLSGQWQGSDMTALSHKYQGWVLSNTMPKSFDGQARKPQFFRFSEHYCCDMDSVVPRDRVENGMVNAWLPQDLQATEEKDGVHFSDAKGTFRRFYKTFRRGRTCVKPEQVVDVIITGKPEMNGSLTLDTVPPEVLEHIAYFTATESFLGPPATLVPLLTANRRINATLSITHNHHLYARIFAYKFDTSAANSRLGSDQLTSWALAEELRHRFIVLNRLRLRLDSTTHARHSDQDDDKMPLYNILFTAYLLMLENEGKNREQLAEYGKIKDWIHEFWFDPYGSSLAVYNIRIGRWPPNHPENALGMWLFWFFLNIRDFPSTIADGPESPIDVLKVLALGAHMYNLTNPTWLEFDPKFSSRSLKPATVYAKSLHVAPPPLATAAILSYTTLLNRKKAVPLPPSDAPPSRQHFKEWESEWGRCFIKSKRNVTECFRPGSIEGVWEGFFTYTEFTAYAALLGGAAPGILHRSVLGRHPQTWKLREHHLLAVDPCGSDSGIDIDDDDVTPLTAGDPLRSYFPIGTQIRENREGLIVQEAESNKVIRYRRISSLDKAKMDSSRVLDVIITGEGHSAWGQFNLVGRVRPCDGFVSLCKDYVDGDRGKWLYRGYLVGSSNGNFAGRWRDTLSPAPVPGYEGCFVMSGRR